MLAEGRGGAPDLAEAYRWTELAALVGAPGATEQRAALDAKLAADQRERPRAAAKAWQPTLGPCLSVNPKRPGTYNFEAVINHVLPDPTGIVPPARRLEWLARNLDQVRSTNPRFLIYLKSLYGISFSSRGTSVAIEARNGQPALVVSELITDAFNPGTATELTRVAVVAIHNVLVPPTRLAQTESYRGRTIRFLRTDDGRRALDVIKAAIDLAETLPPDLQALGRGMTDLRYQPAQQDYDPRGGGGIFTGKLGRDSATGALYMAYSRGIDQRKPRDLVLNLVAGGFQARQSGPDAMRKTQCEEGLLVVKTMEALQFEPAQIGKEREGLRRKNCPA